MLSFFVVQFSHVGKSRLSLSLEALLAAFPIPSSANSGGAPSPSISENEIRPSMDLQCRDAICASKDGEGGGVSKSERGDDSAELTSRLAKRLLAFSELTDGSPPL